MVDYTFSFCHWRVKSLNLSVIMIYRQNTANCVRQMLQLWLCLGRVLFFCWAAQVHVWGSAAGLKWVEMLPPGLWADGTVSGADVDSQGSQSVFGPAAVSSTGRRAEVWPCVAFTWQPSLTWLQLHCPKRTAELGLWLCHWPPLSDVLLFCVEKMSLTHSAGQSSSFFIWCKKRLQLLANGSLDKQSKKL